MAYADDTSTIAATAPQRLVSYADGVWVECSCTTIIGDGVRDVQYLRYGPPVGKLNLWFDTFKHEYNGAPEWYALHFPRPVVINTVYWMHGAVFHEGGWWTSLAIQWCDEDHQWHDVAGAAIQPPYNFANERGNRQPFAAFAAHFEPITTCAIRLIGQPSGTHSMTSMAYLAADYATPTAVAHHLAHMRRPMPRIFEFLPPERLWQIFTSIRALTGVAFDVQTSEGLGLDHFLCAEQHQQFHETQRSILDPTALYSMIGQHEGWQTFGDPIRKARDTAISTLEPTWVEHHGGMVWISIPLLAQGEVLATIENRNLLGLQQIDAAWHEQYCHEAGFDPAAYAAALAAVPVIQPHQLSSIIDFILNITAFSAEIIDNAVEMARLRSIKMTSKLMDQTKRSLMDLMSHELRTPLNAIIGYSEMLLEDANHLTPQVYSDIQQIQHSGKHLLHLITMILEVANIESGTMDVHRQAFEPVEVLHAVAVSLRSSFQKQGNRLLLQTTSDVQPFVADKAKFQQIIFHLISNANKFTHNGQVHVTVQLAPHDNNVLQVSVSDTGIGIAPHDMPHLFAEFGKLDLSPNRRYEGTGMGLALSRHLARLMGGDITAQSTYGKGSCFTLILPNSIDA